MNRKIDLNNRRMKVMVSEWVNEGQDIKFYCGYGQK